MSRKIASIWFVTREYRGLAGAGGVKDVSRDLAEALVRKGRTVRVVMPCYGFLDPSSAGFSPLDMGFDVDMDYVHEERRERVGFFSRTMEGVQVVLVASARFSEKMDVYTYTESDEKADPSHRKGEGHYDYFAMNVLLQKAVLGLSLWEGLPPDVLHCHDGHAACLVPMMRELDGVRVFFRRSGAVVTIHNAGQGYHQDVADLSFARSVTGLPGKVIHGNLLNGSLDPFLAASAYCPVNTVSERYAYELQHTDMDRLTGWLGHALLDRGVTISGITNGIDYVSYDSSNPEKSGLPAGFDPASGDLSGKAVCRKRLGEIIRAGVFEGVPVLGTLEDDLDQPLLTVVSRLSEQKGIDILVDALSMLFHEGLSFQAVVMGTGKKDMEASLAALAMDPDLAGRMAFMPGYSDSIARLVYAAGDFFLISSRYEPCGLTDFIAQLHGNLPIVHATGGLVKVVDGVTGFSYGSNRPEDLAEAVRRAVSLYDGQRDRLTEMVVNAVRNIRENYTWDVVSDRYMELYGEALEKV